MFAKYQLSWTGLDLLLLLLQFCAEVVLILLFVANNNLTDNSQ